MPKYVQQLNPTYNRWYRIIRQCNTQVILTYSEILELVNESVHKNHKIKYYGALNGVNKLNFLKEADIFVLPSFYSNEAFPISILEAIRAGTAIITTKYNYLPCIVKDENGICVSPKSSDAILKAIEFFVSNKEQRLKVQLHNAQYSSQNYSIEKFINKINREIFNLMQ